MGCAPSSRTSVDKSRRESTDSELDALVRQVLATPPPVQIEIGSGISPAPDFMHTVIFIFGGPGSQKGVLMQELAQEFDFVSIAVEDIVFAYLPSKVANTVKNTVEMQELLRRDPAVLTLEWILNMISAKLSTSTSQRFLIDIVPELSSMLRADSFRSRGEHEKRLEHFERRHPVFFAMELFISDEKLLIDHKQNGSSNEDESKAIDTKDLSPELSAFIKGIDEADKGRLEKRLEAYHSCTLPFIRYFQKTKRVIRFDLKVPNNPDVMVAAKKTFMDFGLARNNDTVRVILFVTSERQAGDIDLAYYRLRKVRLSDVCHDRDETLSQQIRTIRKFIYTTAQQNANENFFVILNCLNNTDYPPIKRINFLEYRTTYLDFFIRNREKRNPTVRCKMPFRAITSPAGEVCLFPETMPSKLCKKIGYIFSEKISLSEGDSRSPYVPPTPLDGMRPGGRSNVLELPGTSAKISPADSLVPPSAKSIRSKSEETLRPESRKSTRLRSSSVNVQSILKQETGNSVFNHHGPIPGGLITPEHTLVLPRRSKSELNIEETPIPMITINEPGLKGKELKRDSLIS